MFKTFITETNYTSAYTLQMLYANAPVPNQENVSTVFNTIHRAYTTKDKQDMLRNNNYRALKHYLETLPDIPDDYIEFRIPKSSGGFRTISAPNEQLKQVQSTIDSYLKWLGTHAHDAVYSYTPNRACKDAIIKHQQANTKWFYKFDIKDFFPSCTETVLETLYEDVYPFCLFEESVWKNIMKYALHKGALPQGSPLSPTLSNMVLQPVDYWLYYSIKKFNGVYTRYADDILISLPDKKQIIFLLHIIQNHLKNNIKSNGLELKYEKCRCGSINGSNWNLGLMLNKDHNITLGHKKKQELKAKINNFFYDFTNNNKWSIIDTQVLQGEVNYFKQIEPEYAAFVIKRLEDKYNLNFKNICKQIINNT